MGNKKIIFLLCFILNLLFPVTKIPPFHERNDFLLASSGALGSGLYGLDNPAILTYLHNFDMAFYWSDQRGNWNEFNDWGLFTGLPYLGFSLRNQKKSVGSFTCYNLALALGNRRQGFGIGYEWATSDTNILRQPNILKIGFLNRPVKFFSAGIVGSFATSGGDREGYIDFGFRPLGNEKFTLFGDYAIKKGTALKSSPYSMGIVLEPLSGIRFTARYFNDRSFTIGFNISFGRLGTISQLHFDSQHNHSFNTYGVRLGAYDRNIFQPLIQRKKRYLELDLNGPIEYRRHLLFDRKNTLLSLIKIIDIAKDDPTISGIAINTSGMLANWEMVWELREKLKDFKSTGKNVVIYIDEVEIFGYHLASIADKIVLDPAGSIFLPGLLHGRMYLKGTLDKLGIGVDEWRFFKYKSAAEVLSRENMSEADREQWQAIVDDLYNTLKSDICAGRNLKPEEFDQLVNQEVIFLPKEALARGLVDTIGRWTEIKDVVASIEGRKKTFVSPPALVYYQLPRDDHWGERPKVAIIYALGECAMDTGIKARSLVRDIEEVTERKDIKAVVFRVDSPGGSALASDIVAEALKKCSKKKPVIVSQGLVAGSGGYWLSMYGNEIVSAPGTITGSIGVIGVWIYNKEFKEKLGVSTDFVKAGEHADIGFGFNFPFLGQIPDRNLTEEERKKMEHQMKTLYKDFITKVAEGRKMKTEEIEEIAQGRVWSGIRAKDIGLVDTLGGLETAIMLAKEKSGIPRDEEITIVEYPRPEVIAPDFFKPRLIEVDKGYAEFIHQLNFYARYNGQALPVMPIETITEINNWTEAIR
ncbi:MAG: signal peptide peptidase SppA [candidate division WOR-3 bacterium]